MFHTGRRSVYRVLAVRPQRFRPVYRVFLVVVVVFFLLIFGNSLHFGSHSSSDNNSDDSELVKRPPITSEPRQSMRAQPVSFEYLSGILVVIFCSFQDGPFSSCAVDQVAPFVTTLPRAPKRVSLSRPSNMTQGQLESLQ